MFESLKESWKLIRSSPPGKRFRRQYRRRKKARKSTVDKLVLIGIGVMIVVGGIIMLPAPGPGTLIIFLGLGLIAQESLWLSIMLDKLELKLRALGNWSLRKWRNAHIVVKLFIALAAIAAGAVFAYGLYWYFFIR